MPSKDFNSDQFHKKRIETVRVGDIVLDTGIQEFNGFRIQVIAMAGARSADRSTWFQEMIFGSHHADPVEGKEVT